MKKTALFPLVLWMLIGCKAHPDLTSQLTTHLSSRLAKIDSSAVIDSFKIVGVDTIVPRLGKVIDDTIYIRLLHTVEAQLADALTKTNKDSIQYFQGEVNYMKGQIDTLTASIATADTTDKFGILARCRYGLSKNGKTKKDSVFYFIDKTGNIINNEMLDSLLAMSCRGLQ